MAVEFQKYHKNIDNITLSIMSGLISQEKKLDGVIADSFDFRHKYLKSFFKEDKTPNIYIKWYSPLSSDELNAIIINLDNVEFSAHTTNIQIAKARYNIDIIAAQENHNDVIDSIGYVSGIIRETLIKTPISFFAAKSTFVEKLIVSADNISNDTKSVITTRMIFELETKEELTDYDEIDGARANMTNATGIVSKINGGTYSIYKEW